MSTFLSVLSSSGFGITLTLVTQHNLESVPASAMFQKSLCRFAVISSKCSIDFTGEAIWAYTFFLEWALITNSIYLPDMEPFQFPVSFCLSFGKLHLSRNLSISPKLSYLLAQSFLNIPGDFAAGSQLSEDPVSSQRPSTQPGRGSQAY